MADIIEVPLDTPVNETESQDNSEILQNTDEILPEIVEEIQQTPKKKGRPAGAKNKPKAKPKSKPKVRRVQFEEESEAEEPPSMGPRRNHGRERNPAAPPVEQDPRAIAAEVLNILTEQKRNRQAMRRSHYASWFENQFV